MSTIIVENVHKYYGNNHVIKGINFTINTGEILGILGPNGAGKTTSFYTIVGITMPSDGKITLEDMAGGTFTITNGGVFGSMMGTPIINMPQSAILGMHATKVRPVVVGSQILARPIMYVALTYDHRIIDGREAVLFLKKIKECIEEPQTILFDI